MSAVFRETDPNMPPDARGIPASRLVGIGVVLGLVLVGAGLAMVWLPLALIVTGASLIIASYGRALR